MNKTIDPAAEPLAPDRDDVRSNATATVAAAAPLPAPRPHPAVEKTARRPAMRKVVTTLNLTSRTCKWPIGDPTQPDFHYCGRPPQSGRPYCDTHDGMSYQSARRR